MHTLYRYISEEELSSLNTDGFITPHNNLIMSQSLLYVPVKFKEHIIPFMKTKTISAFYNDPLPTRWIKNKEFPTIFATLCRNLFCGPTGNYNPYNGEDRKKQLHVLQMNVDGKNSYVCDWIHMERALNSISKRKWRKQINLPEKLDYTFDQKCEHMARPIGNLLGINSQIQDIRANTYGVFGYIQNQTSLIEYTDKYLLPEVMTLVPIKKEQISVIQSYTLDTLIEKISAIDSKFKAKIFRTGEFRAPSMYD